MNFESNIIWRKGDGEMPKHARHVVRAAQDELLLMSLQLPIEVADLIRSNANKNSQSINDYISSIVVGYFKTA